MVRILGYRVGCRRNDRATPTRLETRKEETAVNEPEAAPAGPAQPPKPSYAADRAKILTRLRRIEGQVRGVARMVEEDQYCVDILTQLSAAVAGLRATGNALNGTSVGMLSRLHAVIDAGDVG